MFKPFSYHGKGILPRRLVCDGMTLFEKVLWKKQMVDLDRVIYYTKLTSPIKPHDQICIGGLIIDQRRYPLELMEWIAIYFDYREDGDPEYDQAIMNLAIGIFERFHASGNQRMQWTAKFDGQTHQHDIYFGESVLDLPLPARHRTSLAYYVAEIAAGNQRDDGTLNQFEMKIAGDSYIGKGSVIKRRSNKFAVPTIVLEAHLTLIKFGMS